MGQRRRGPDSAGPAGKKRRISKPLEPPTDSEDDYGDSADSPSFSSDDDDEEKLTAANIVGLSRKLDKKLEADKAAGEAELRESALQTNIDADDDALDEADDDDDEATAKTKLLLTPNLQLLRQRITDVVQSLEHGDKAGRSRADLVAQHLKDICAVRLFVSSIFFFHFFPFLVPCSFLECSPLLTYPPSTTTTARSSRRNCTTSFHPAKPSPSSRPMRRPGPW